MATEFHRFLKWKVLLYSDKIANIVRGEIPYPVVWHIYPTNICPLNCTFCIMREEKILYRNVSLSERTMGKIASDASTHNIKLVHFSGGGEPLVHPSTRVVAKQLRQQGVKVALSTNGVLLKESDAEFFDHIRISIDAASPKVFEQTKHGNFDMIIENVHNMIQYRNKFKPQTDIGLGYVVTVENIPETAKFVKLGEKLGCDFIHFRPCYYKDDEQNAKLRESFLSATLKMKQIASKTIKPSIYWVDYKFSGFWTSRNYSKCRATPLQAVLSATGEFIVCQDVFIRFGDYNKQSFNEVWFSEEHKNAMEKIDITRCPRCVENFHNEVIEHMFLDNECRNELI